ncbi:MAG TPA: hypothetical protein VNO30_31725 [Kofleriaceae bacterium]|nr:hypothetical protein [Kofleriaceae bacterium]
MTPSYHPANAKNLEAPWDILGGEDEPRLAAGSNHSVPVEAYDTTAGICNELARIALNRSAVIAAYDSMFPRSTPRSGLPRAGVRRTVPSTDSPRPRWVQRLLGFLLRRRPRSIGDQP